MKKRLLMGALALSATAVLGLVGCGDKKKEVDPPAPETTKYTVTFDHDNDASTSNVEVKFEEGTTSLNPSQIPLVPSNSDGYAGVWDWNGTLTDENFTVVAKYGNGEKTNPYLVSNGRQLAQIIKDYSTVSEIEYLDEYGCPTDEATAIKKIETYKAVKLTYRRADGNWGTPAMEIIGTKKYYKITNDITLSDTGYATFSNAISGYANLQKVYFNGEIDGGYYNESSVLCNHSISALDGSMFKSTEGAMFNTIVGATFKNLNINLGKNIGSLVGIARGGENVFENINVYSTNNLPTILTADDNNESPFIVHAIGEDTKLEFKSCTNYANMISAADYYGIFLGGYAKDVESLKFENCVNKGTIKSLGSVGVLTGNGHYNPKQNAITITNCKNEGTIISVKPSHILVSSMAGSGLINSKTAEYDTADYGYIKEHQDESKITFKTLSSDYKATIASDDIIISNKETDQDVAKGRYQLVLSAMAANTAGTGYKTIKLNVVIERDVAEATEGVVFDDVYYGFMDLNTYNTTNSTTIASDNTWKTLTGYSNIKYKLIEGIYVFDFSQHEAENDITNNKMVINSSAAQLSKAVVVYETRYSSITNIQYVAQFN